MNPSEIKQLMIKKLTCPVCGEHYHLSDLHVSGFFNSLVILDGICKNSHTPSFTRFIILVAKPLTVKDRPPFVAARAPRQISPDDILDFCLGIKNFDGNFEKLWSKN